MEEGEKGFSLSIFCMPDIVCKITHYHVSSLVSSQLKSSKRFGFFLVGMVPPPPRPPSITLVALFKPSKLKGGSEPPKLRLIVH